jgi:ABC-2 type transport system ATP-binding protein
LPQLRSQIGYLPQDLDLPTSLTPRRLLEYLKVLKNFTEDSRVANTLGSLICKPASLGWDIDQLLSTLGLEVIAGSPIGRLSGGHVRMAGIAQAFLGCPNLLLLDELTHGLDVEERPRVFSLVRQPVPRRLILFSTHDPADTLWLADRVIVLRRGQVVFFGEIYDFHRQVQDTLHSI